MSTHLLHPKSALTEHLNRIQKHEEDAEEDDNNEHRDDDDTRDELT